MMSPSVKIASVYLFYLQASSCELTWLII